MQIHSRFPTVLGIHEQAPTKKLSKVPRRGAGQYSTNGARKLQEQQVKEIRWLREYRMWTFKSLAETYKVSVDTVKFVCSYLTWRYVNVQYKDFPEDFNPCSEASSSS